MSSLTSSSLTVSLNGNSSTLSSYFQPAIELDRYSYSLALLEFHTYNSIPNVTKFNNKFIVRHNHHLNLTYIPEGAYEVDALIAYINKYFASLNLNVVLEANKSTFKCSIKSDPDLTVDFRDEGSIGPLLGFDHRRLQGSTEYIAHKIVNIQIINSVRVNCDLVAGSYHNDKPSHTIYEFSPAVGPGFKIIEQPVNLIYLPINRKTMIGSLHITICDQNDSPIDFRGENITCRLHIKRDSL